MRILAAAAFLLASAAAQNLTEPPLLVRLIHAASAEADPARAYADARASVNVFGVTGVSGPAGVWLIEAQDSFAGIESVDRILRGTLPGGPPQQPVITADIDLLPPGRAAIAIYRPNLSYRAEQAIRALPRSRYLQFSIRRMRPGADNEIMEAVRGGRSTLASINADLPMIAYQVVMGAPVGTYLFITPLVALSTLDDALSRLAAAYSDSAGDAVGKAMKSSPASEISRETVLFRIEPRLSYVSAEFAAGDPDFWTPKSAPQ